MKFKKEIQMHGGKKNVWKRCSCGSCTLTAASVVNVEAVHMVADQSQTAHCSFLPLGLQTNFTLIYSVSASPSMHLNHSTTTTTTFP